MTKYVNLQIKLIKCVCIYLYIYIDRCVCVFFYSILYFWVAVKTMIPFGVPKILAAVLYSGSKKGP